jgi:hypothetical protein
VALLGAFLATACCFACFAHGAEPSSLLCRELLTSCSRCLMLDSSTCRSASLLLLLLLLQLNQLLQLRHLLQKCQ